MNNNEVSDSELVDFDVGAPAQQPPGTKQGGSKTSPDGGGIWCGIDWLTASYPRHFHPDELCREVEEMLRRTGQAVTGEHGYIGNEVCGGYGKVLQRAARDSGDGDVLVRLPGRALDWIRDNNIFSETELQCTDADICRFFLDLKFSSTRLDIAMDSDDPAITPEKVEALIAANSYQCRAKKVGVNDSWSTDRPEDRHVEETVYLGSRLSSRFFRCYNKAADIFRKTGRKVGHLTRFELEMKGDAAQKAMELIAQYGNYCIPRLFAGWIDFKDPHDDASRVERRRSVDWWERLICNTEPIVLGLHHAVTSPEQSLRWVKEQVAKTLCLAHRHGLFEEVIEAINAKKYRIKPSENEKWKHYASLKRQSPESSKN